MKLLKNIVALLVGWLGGSAVNMGLVTLGHTIFPMEGVDTNSMEALAEAMPTMEAKHFLFPFLAHALGTLVGAVLAAVIAASHKQRIAMAIGIFFLVGGLMMVYMLPGPVWFTVLDLLVAYIPMAWLGARLVNKRGEK